MFAMPKMLESVRCDGVLEGNRAATATSTRPPSSRPVSNGQTLTKPQDASRGYPYYKPPATALPP
ncbi:hypothetical protein SAMN06265222_12276 [Neorhodopirellula lusitana]|uniref:Uncharacterized protein n=1 Tax=Neorhodopirellula lusitana TaxID=445327 RepID=A0ABY1QRH5_9BACT|nr:hypothetical protein [Neorhodopirellula lusitana]SMP77053.1 hypothetical protein SAMN06265222_12276 [Neorhodopirellula lusitana]